MKFQAKNWSCGPAAVINGLRCLGIKVSEKEARLLAGTTAKDGTDTPGMLLAINRWAKGESFDVVGFDAAVELIDPPTIICVHGWKHWVTVIGITGSRFIVADPSTAKRNKAENGIRIMTRVQLKKWWAHGRTYSGIIVSTP